MAGTTMSNNRKPYNGDRRALVLAFDVGTTFSGVSYAFLEPGEVPKIHGVTRYPGQEHVTGNTKIPSLLYYDREGNVVAAGAEAESGQIVAEAEDEGWSKVELFKLRLRPRRMELDMNGLRLAPLPAGKSSEDVFGDFLSYLFVCTRKFIEDTHANGKKLWRAIEKDIHFVLSHPNGWEGAQQSRMRRSAIGGGLIPNTDEGKARIRFVTEGEASMHACILSGLAHDVLASGNGFIVADAGGGTLDVSSYILRGTHPLQIEEVAPPDCLFSGAVFVSRRCRVFLQEKLRTSKYGSPDTLDHITKRFDETTKRLFRDKHDAQYIPFGSPLDKDIKAGIRGGQLKLTGAEVAELFEPSIQAAVTSIRRQVELSRGAVKAVWLVGGFAASPWLFSQLQQRLAPMGVTVNRPDNQTSKAVADGAIGFFCDHHVSARMARYMYGVEYLREIDVNDQDHVTRSGRQLQLPSGPKYLPDAFDCILAKNVRVKESSVFSRKYYTEVTKLSTLSVFEIEIWCYRGGETIPKWIDRNSDHFGSLCFVRADLSRLSNSAEPKKGANGQTYWTVVFSIEIHFGLTEFKARMKWNEDGKTRYGPATIVFNEKGVRSDEDDAYSIAGGDESMPVSPRRPYGSLVSHSTRDGTSAGRSSRHRERDRDRGMSRDHVHNPPAPPLSGTGMSRSMSGQTDTTSVDTVTREPSPSPPPPPVASSVSSTLRGKSKSRALSATPQASVHDFAPEEPEFEPPALAPSIHSRPSAMHSRSPSTAAPVSIHSRAPSVAAPPSVHSRVPSVVASPSLQSRAPSAAASPSMHSRAPSAAPPPSMHSRAPSAAGLSPSIHSRVPSVVPSPAASRAPSAAPSAPPSIVVAPSPAPSRTPSAASRPSLSRAPSSGQRVPSVVRQSSSRGGYGSVAPSQMDPVEEAETHPPAEAADEFLDVGPPGGLDGARQRSRSPSPAPAAERPATTSRRNSWVLPSVSEAPPAPEKKDDKKSWGWGGGWGSMLGGKPADDAGDVPLANLGNNEEPFVPPPPGGANWEEPAPAVVTPEPEVELAPPPPPPVGKTSSSRSGKNKDKKPKGILKNNSASSRAAEAEAEAKAEAEARARAEAEEAYAREQAEAEERARYEAEMEERARHEAEIERARQEAEQAEYEARAREEAARLEFEAAEREREEQERQEAEYQAMIANEKAEAEERARVEAEREQAAAEAEARAREEESARAEAEAAAKKAAEDEEWARAEAEAAQAQADADAVAAAAAAASAPTEPGAAALLTADSEKEKLESALVKAEADLVKAEDEFNSAEIALAKVPKPKGGKKAKPSPAYTSAERTVGEKEKALEKARAKVDKARDAFAAYVPPAGTDIPPLGAVEPPPAPAPAQEELPLEDMAPSLAGNNEKGLLDFGAADDKGEEKGGDDFWNSNGGEGANAETEAPAVSTPAEPAVESAAEPAIDEEKTKLEDAVTKAEADLQKAEDELNSAEIALVKAPKPKKKGAKAPAAMAAAERAVKEKEKALEKAKTKLDSTKEALEAYVPPAAPAAPPPAPALAPAELSEDLLPPVGKTPSFGIDKGMFSFGASGENPMSKASSFGLGDKDGDDEEEDEDKEEGGGLWGGGGGGWGVGTGGGGGSGGGWGFSGLMGGGKSAKGKSGGGGGWGVLDNL